jgi:hypothetical protein
MRLDQIVGDERVEAIVVSDHRRAPAKPCPCVASHSARDGARSDALRELVDCDARPRGVNERLETSAPFVLACGIRGSTSRVASAIEDGRQAAERAAALLNELANTARS